jgi:dephospho-CoA kinase
MGTVVGLVGFRCSGKSTIRGILADYDVPVFDTNVPETGDPDADIIGPRTILDRYGSGESYFRFLRSHVLAFDSTRAPVWFIDSLKTEKDPTVLKEILPSTRLVIWYLHAPFNSRLARYRCRDLASGKRTDSLAAHDKSLEDLGIFTLIKDASEVICTDVSFSDLREEVKSKLSKLLKLSVV